MLSRAGLSRQHGHLARAAKGRVAAADVVAQKVAAVSMRQGLGPSAELRPGPFKAVPGVAEAARRHAEQGVELCIRRRDDCNFGSQDIEK